MKTTSNHSTHNIRYFLITLLLPDMIFVEGKGLSFSLIWKQHPFAGLSNGPIRFGLLTCYRAGLNIHGVIFGFRRVALLKLLMLKVIKCWFANNDFQNTVLDTLEQTLSKSACQWN